MIGPISSRPSTTCAGSAKLNHLIGTQTHPGQNDPSPAYGDTMPKSAAVEASQFRKPQSEVTE